MTQMQDTQPELPTNNWAEDRFIPGTSSVPSNGVAAEAERKSPPLDALIDDVARFTRISAQAYYDPGMVAIERERLWGKAWLCAGRASDAAQPGDWFRFDIAGESLIVSRLDDGNLTAFFNVCQHRANRLVDQDFGNARQFMCAYHSWRYDRAGRCTHVTDRAFFRSAALAGSLDIPAVACETYGGFVFVCLDPEALPLSDYLGEIVGITRGYALDRMEVRADVEIELACNWKVMLDAFSEVYHAHVTHPDTIALIEDRFNQIDFYPNGHSRRIVPVGEPGSRRGPTVDINAAQRAFLQWAGIDPDTFGGNAREVRRAVQIAKRAQGSVYDGLSDNQLTDDWATNIFPNTHWSLHADGLLMLRYLPHPTDPDACTLSMMVLALPDVPFDMYPIARGPALPSGRPQRIRVRHDDADLPATISQLIYEDIRNTRETQQGMKSKGFGGLRLSDHEQILMHQHAEIERYVGRAPALP